MYNALEAGLLSQNGINTWMPIATAANVAQGAAALAVAVKTKNAKTKSMALPASLSAFLGITEPAIFGVNVRYMKPFVAGCIGGACGGLVAGLFGIGASAYGITGIFGFLITTGYTVPYALVMIIAAAVAFVLSWIMYRDKEDVKTEKQIVSENAGAEEALKMLDCPVNGKVILLSEVNDEIFAGEVLGKGFAVVPEEGKIYAPFDCSVEMVADTKHALGLKSESGIELLIHVGLNTVELNGEGFTVYAEQGQQLKKGQLLMEFDPDKIQKAGYDTTIPVIVTNTQDAQEIRLIKQGAVKAFTPVLSVS